MTDIRTRLTQFAGDLKIHHPEAFSRWNPMRWFAFLNLDSTRDEHRVLFGTLIGAWGFLTAVGFLFGILFNLITGVSSIPMLVFGVTMMGFGLFSALDTRSGYKRLLGECRWLLDDAEVNQFLCSDEGKQCAGLKVALIELEDHLSGTGSLWVNDVFQRLYDALMSAFKADQDTLTALDLVHRFGSAHAVKEVDFQIQTLKDAYAKNGLQDASEEPLSPIYGDGDGPLSIGDSEKSLKGQWHAVQDQMQDRCAQFYEGVMNDVPPGMPRFLRRYQMTMLLKDDQQIQRPFWFRVETRFLSMMAAGMPSIVMTLPVMWAAPTPMFVVVVLMTVLGGRFLSKRWRQSMAGNAKTLSKADDGTDLLLMDLFYQQTLGLDVPDTKLDTKLRDVRDLLESAEDYRKLGLVKELWMARSLKVHYDRNLAKQRRFERRCVAA